MVRKVPPVQLRWNWGQVGSECGRCDSGLFFLGVVCPGTASKNSPEVQGPKTDPPGHMYRPSHGTGAGKHRAAPRPTAILTTPACMLNHDHSFTDPESM